MAYSYDPEPSTLLCDESKDLCFDDLDDHDDDDQTLLDVNNQSCPWGCSLESEPLIHFPAQSEDDFASMVKREINFLPKHDYLTRLRCGLLGLSARKEAFDWIWKAHSHYSFGPLSLCLAVNYLDRFLSIRELPCDSAWAVQLLAVACLSIAAKIDESSVPQSIDFQVGDPKFVFEAKTIQKMELLVLDTLNWKMNAVTPCSFLDYSLKKLSDAQDSNSICSTTNSIKNVNRSMQLILCTIRGIDFLEFKPSEIAVAVAMFVAAEIQAVDNDKFISCFIHLEKGRVLKCAEMIKNMSQISPRTANVGVPSSPIGVLEAASFSYKSDELTTTTTTTTVVGSFGNSSSQIVATTTSSSNSPETKRRKLDTTTRI